MDSSKAKKLAETIVAIEPCGKSKTGKEKLYNVLLTGGKKTGGIVVGNGMHTEREARGVADTVRQYITDVLTGQPGDVEFGQLLHALLTWRDVLRHVDEDDRVVQVRNMRRDIERRAREWEQAAGIPAQTKSEEDEEDEDEP